MSRGRLFVLIDTFEQDMRRIVEHYLVPHFEETDLLGADHDDAVRRRAADRSGDDASIIQYLNLRQCYDLMLRKKRDLSHELSEEISANVGHIDILAPIRNRVMHGRPLALDDPDRAISALIAFSSRHWEGTREILARLRKDPMWEPAFQRKDDVVDTVLHNLPEPDYDETGFVGRRQEALRLLQALTKGRDNVITITGEGGIGKTALALDVAYRLLDSPDNPFEAILWVSLKTERLTAYGVEELSDAIRGMDETVLSLGRNLSSDFSGRLADLSESLQGITCLVIIDNLESAQGNEVIELYEALPDSVKYLFTSRLGIGQLERRYPLPSLEPEEAKLLFRKFSTMRAQRQLAAASEKTLDEVLVRLRYSPLAIRWYILSTEAGKPPLDTLRSQQELLDFCVKNVFDGLGEGSRAVLSILRALDRSISFDEFAVLTEMTIDDLRLSTQELTRGALVVVEAESAGAIAGRLAMTATARAFLQRPDRTGAFIEQVLQRERQYRASLEQRASSGQRLDPRVVMPRDENDNPATYMLYTALRFARSSQFVQAISHVSRARSFNPEFSEVYRVAGNIEALEGRYESAVSEYQTALTYAKEPWSNAMTSYALADVMARRIHNSHLALPHAQRAYERWPNDESAFLLGRIKVWTGSYEEGQVLIEEALEASTGRHRTIVAAAHVDSWARWAESSLKGKRYAEAVRQSIAGLHSGASQSNTALSDLKLMEAIAECSIVLLRAIPLVPGECAKQEKRLIGVGKLLENKAAMLQNSRKQPFVVDAIRSCLASKEASTGARHALQKASEALTAPR